MSKIIPWARAVLIILSLILGPLSLFSASASVPAETVAGGDPVVRAGADPVPGAGSPLRQGDDDAVQPCKLRVIAPAVEAVPEDPIFTSPPLFGATGVTTANNTDSEGNPTELTIWVLVANWTNSGEEECTQSEELTDLTVELEINGSPVALPAPDPSTLPAHQSYWEATVTYQVSASTASPVHIHLMAEALDSDGDLTRDYDDWFVNLLEPGFTVESFTPSVASASPDEQVDFTIQIKNVRNGVAIDAITAAWNTTGLTNACDGIGNWTLVGGTGGSFSVLNYNQEAECTVTGATVPNPAEDTYSLTGTLTAHNGGASASLEVASDPVLVNQPSISVTKQVQQIRRGGQMVQPPAAPGDQIDYLITVENTSQGTATLDHISIVDSLTGLIYVAPSTTLAPGEQLPPITVQWTVLPNGADPLTNVVSVSARAAGYGDSIQDQAAASVDIVDSALTVTLDALNPTDDSPLAAAEVGDPVKYRMTLHNEGDEVITGVDYAPVTAPQQTVGTPPALDGLTLNAGGTRTFNWTYTIQATDPDPLSSTVRVRGTSDGRTLTAQDQADVDIANPDISISVAVAEPLTPTVLRGGEAIFEITVANKSTASPVCNVVVSQYRRDPDTGNETPIVPSIPMHWPTGTPGRLDPGGAATATTTYLVTTTEKDPLHMVFEVEALSDCGGGTPLSDRTSRTLDISDVQVNSELRAEVGADGVAEVGEPLTFRFFVTNVAAIALDDVTATYCFPSREPMAPPNCLVSLPLSNLTGGSLLQYQTAEGMFTTVIDSDDADAVPFYAEVTLTGTDNEGHEVSMKTSTIVPIATEDLFLTLEGPAEAVSGDTRTFNYTITNDTGVNLTDVHVYDMLVPDSGGYQEVDFFDTLSGLSGENTISDSFEHLIEGTPGSVLQMQLRVVATMNSNEALANATFGVTLIPMVGVVKSGPATAIPGDDVTYTVTITNNAEDQTLTLSDYADDVLASYSIDVTAANFTWPAAPGTLLPGESASAELVVTEVQATPTPLVNTFTATGTSTSGETVSGSAQHTVDISCPIDFLFDGVHNTDDQPDDILHETLEWTIRFQNVSQATLTTLNVTESLHWGGNAPIINWPGTPGILEPGEVATIQTFTKEITNEYYHDGEDFMEDTLTAGFDQVAGATSCSETYKYYVWSPILVTKFAEPTLAFTGDTVTYEFYIENLTEDNDQYNRYTILSGEDSLLTPNPVPFQIGGGGDARTSFTLGPGETATATLTRDVVQDDPEELINTIIVTFPDPADSDFEFYTWSEAKVITTNPLQIVKRASATQGIPGTDIYYDYEINNVTEYTIQNVTLVDDKIGVLIPSGFNEQTLNPLTLGPFESVTLEAVPYKIPLNTEDPLVNIATIEGTVLLPDGPRGIINQVAVAVDIKDPDVTVEKSVIDAATGEPLPDALPITAPEGDGIPEGLVGQEVRYCFLVENHNPGTETYVDNIEIEDANFGTGTLQPLFEAAVVDAYDHDAEADRLYGGESVEFCYPQGSATYTLNAALGDPLVNHVTLEGESLLGEGTIPVYSEDELTIDLLGTDLQITKSTSQPLAFSGEEVIYTLRLENRNLTRTILDIEVTDAFQSSGVTDIAIEDFDWSANNNGGTPGTLGVGGVATYSYSYVIGATDPDPLINTAHAVGYLDDAVEPSERTRVEDTTRSSLAVTASQLLVRKTATPVSAQPGDSVHYTVAVTNVGKLTVHELSATDTQVTGEMPITPSVRGTNDTSYLSYDLDMPDAAALAADPSLDPFINTITVQGTVFDEHGNPVDEPVIGQATASVDIIQPNVRLTKSPSVPGATPGQDVLYTVTIQNTGGAAETLSGLVFNDISEDETIDLDAVCEAESTEPCEFFYGTSPYGDYDEDETTPDGPNPWAGEHYDPEHGLQAGETLTYSFMVTVPADYEDSEFTNVAEIVAQVAPNADTVRDRSSATIDIRSEGIQVRKTANVPAAPVGAPIEYTLRIENIGGVPIDRLTIADPALTGGSVSVTDGFPSTEDDPGTLDRGEIYTYQYTHTLSLTDGDPYVNRARVTAFTSAGSSIVNVAQATVDVQAASIGIEKYVCVEGGATLPDPCTQVVNVADQTPDEVTYYLRIFNPGAVLVENIALTDTLVPSTTFDSIVWPETANTLAPNDDAPGGNDEVWFSYTYTIQPGDLDPLENLVTVAGQTATVPAQPVHDTATASVNLVTGDLALTKSGPAQAQVGDTVTYTLTVEHLDPTGEPITNITITDPLNPDGCTIATLAAGTSDSSCTYTHTITTSDPRPLNNQASAVGMQTGAPDGVVMDSASHTLEIVTPGLSVTKLADVQTAIFGQTVTFTYRVENSGATGITNLSVTDSDPDITFDSPWPTTLPAGQVAVHHATRTMTELDTDAYTNTVTVQGQRGMQTIHAQATETVYLSDAALVVSNVPDRLYALDGQSVRFTYTLRNVGSDPITTLSISDTLCGDLTGDLPTMTLAPHASLTASCAVTAELPGPIVSTVRVSGMAGSTPVSDTATAEVQVTSGGLLVVKEADRAVAQADDTVSYSVTVTNVGDEPLTSFTVYDPTVLLLPAPPEVLQPGASFTMSGDYFIPASDPPDSLANLVSVSAAGVYTEEVYQDADSAAVAILENELAELALTKQATVSLGDGHSGLRAHPGDDVTYTFTIRNVTDAATTGAITLEDTMLGAPIPIDPLGPGEVTTLTRSVMIPADQTDPTFVNTASVVTTVDQTPTTHDTASASVPVQLLTLEKAALVTRAEPGDEVDYTFTVRSLTIGAVHDVAIDDPGLTFDTVLPTTIGESGADASGHLTIPVDHAGDTFENTATLTVDGEEMDKASATVEINRDKLLIELLSVTQASDTATLDGSASAPLKVGGATLVEFSTSNVGENEITDLAYAVSFGGTDVECTIVQGSLTDPLPVSGARTVVCQFVMPDLDFTSSAAITADVEVEVNGMASGEAVTNSATDTYTIVDLELGVEIALTQDGAPITVAPPGDIVTATITLSNVGASPLGCSAVVDAAAPCHFSLTTEVEALDTAIDGVGDNVLRDLVLTSGGEQIYVLQFEVPDDETLTQIVVQASAGFYSEEVATEELLTHYTVMGTGSADFTPAIPDVTVLLSVYPNPPVFGQNVTYTLTIQNTGLVDITGLAAQYQITPYSTSQDTGIMLMSSGARPSAQQYEAGTIALNTTTLAPGATANGILSKIENQRAPYLFSVTVSGMGLVTEIPVSENTQISLSPTGAGTATPTIDPATLDPNATEPEVSKASGAEAAQPGGAVTWTITVRNGSTGLMDGVTLLDAVPETMAIVSAASDRGTATVEGNLVSVGIGALNPGEIATITLSTTVSAAVASPATITNTACAARSGGPQVCDVGTVNIGPSVGGLPATGLRSGGALGWRLDGLFGVGFAGALMLLMAVSPSRRRTLIALAFVLIALIAIGGAVALLVTRDDDTPPADDSAQVIEDATDEPAAPPAAMQEATDAAPDDPFAQPTPYVLPTPAGVRTLMIPKLADTFRAPIPIMELPITDRQWDVSGLGYYVGWLEGTTWMDPSWGNTVLAAHVQLDAQTPGPFWGLSELVPGDEIIVREGTKEYTYVVTSTRAVKPNDWTVTAPTDGPTLTLLTCTNWSEAYGVFSERLVVQAVPAEM